jgi:hypothetical protein
MRQQEALRRIRPRHLPHVLEDAAVTDLLSDQGDQRFLVDVAEAARRSATQLSGALITA